jgi:hypothetical protein
MLASRCGAGATGAVWAEFDQDAAGVAEPAAGSRRRGSPVSRTFHLLDEFRHIIQGKRRLEITEIAGRDLEGLSLSREGGNIRCLMQKLSSVGKFHGTPPWRI